MKCPKGHEMINRAEILDWTSEEGLAHWYCPICRCEYKKNLTEQLKENGQILSDIEINDIKQSAREFTSGEAPVFDSVDELFKYIDESEERNEEL